MTKQDKGWALVTGASNGIGAVYADRLARDGYDLVLVARSAGKLEAIAAQIRTSSARQVELMVADLGTADGVAQVEQRLRDDARISMLVNNAGVGAVMPLLHSPVDAMEQLITLNITAVTRLAYAAATAMAARGAGTIINISSIVAIGPEILNGVYGGSKAFVLALSQSMHHELAGQGVRIQAVLPGATATDFWAVAGNPVENLPSSIVMRADDMVDAALAGLAQGEVVTIPSLHEGGKWTRYEAARRELSGLFGNAAPAPRYTPAAA
ncbi:MAG: SDR family NAD(P)-dependent oxidoreductase [Massilia sp.]